MIHKITTLALILSSVSAGPLVTPFQQGRALRTGVLAAVAHLHAAQDALENAAAAAAVPKPKPAVEAVMRAPVSLLDIDGEADPIADANAEADADADAEANAEADLVGILPDLPPQMHPGMKKELAARKLAAARDVEMFAAASAASASAGEKKIGFNKVGDLVARQQADFKPAQACAELDDLQALLFSTNCTAMFLVENSDDFAATAEASCATCDFDGAQAIIDALPSACADDDFGDSGLDFMWPMIKAICAEETAGDYCGIPVGNAMLLGFSGEGLNVSVVEAGCEEGCSALFFQTYVDANLEGLPCSTNIFPLNLICIPDGDGLCVEDLAPIFGEADATDGIIGDFCASSCGRTFLDEFNTQYLEQESCYAEDLFNMAQYYCAQYENADGDADGYCILDVEQYEDTNPLENDTTSQCPEGEPSAWGDTCSAACATEMQAVSDELGCCINMYFTSKYVSEEEGDVAVDWVNNACADVTLDGDCPTSYTPASSTSSMAVSTRGPPNSVILAVSVVTSLLMLLM